MQRLKTEKPAKKQPSTLYTLDGFIKYQITALNHTFYLYPKESDYVFSI